MTKATKFTLPIFLSLLLLASCGNKNTLEPSSAPTEEIVETTSEPIPVEESPYTDIAGSENLNIQSTSDFDTLPSRSEDRFLTSEVKELLTVTKSELGYNGSVDSFLRLEDVYIDEDLVGSWFLSTGELQYTFNPDGTLQVTYPEHSIDADLINYASFDYSDIKVLVLTNEVIGDSLEGSSGDEGSTGSEESINGADDIEVTDDSNTTDTAETSDNSQDEDSIYLEYLVYTIDDGILYQMPVVELEPWIEIYNETVGEQDETNVSDYTYDEIIDIRPQFEVIYSVTKLYKGETYSDISDILATDINDVSEFAGTWVDKLGNILSISSDGSVLFNGDEGRIGFGENNYFLLKLGDTTSKGIANIVEVWMYDYDDLVKVNSEYILDLYFEIPDGSDSGLPNIAKYGYTDTSEGYIEAYFDKQP